MCEIWRDTNIAVIRFVGIQLLIVLPYNSYYFSKANCDGPSIIIVFHNLSPPNSLPRSKLKICLFQRIKFTCADFTFFLFFYFIYCYFPKGKELQDYQQRLLERLMDHSNKTVRQFTISIL